MVLVTQVKPGLHAKRHASLGVIYRYLVLLEALAVCPSPYLYSEGCKTAPYPFPSSREAVAPVLKDASDKAIGTRNRLSFAAAKQEVDRPAMALRRLGRPTPKIRSLTGDGCLRAF